MPGAQPVINQTGFPVIANLLFVVAIVDSPYCIIAFIYKMHSLCQVSNPQCHVTHRSDFYE